MKQVAHIHVPRTAGLSMMRWGNEYAPSFQKLYKPKKTSRARNPGKFWDPHFDPTVQWTYMGHGNIGDLLSNGTITQDWWDGVFKFAFVRNTYPRLVSLFEFARTRRFRRIDDGNWTNAHLLHFHDYIHYVTSGRQRSVRTKDTKPWPAFHERQLPWLNYGVDFIGRHSHIDEDWEKLCAIIGIEYRQLVHRNRPRDYLDMRKRLIDGWRGYYTDELRGMVAEFFADEIERFGFKFEE